MNVIDIGSGKWDPDYDGPWVTKIDLVEYLRCPHRVFLSRRDGIPYRDFLTPTFQELILGRGINFEEDLRAERGITEVTSLDDAYQREGVISIRATLRNHGLGIKGIPDAVWVKGKQLIPIEIKSHNKVQHSDELELAFYCMLLAPHPEKLKGRESLGYLLLSSGEIRPVPLYPFHFARVRDLIKATRKTIVKGRPPTLIQECQRCTLKEEHIQVMRQDRDVSLVYDIGPSRRGSLEELGITTIDALVSANIYQLYEEWRGIDRYAPSHKQIQAMVAHAKALATGTPQELGEVHVPHIKHGIILDLEYLTLGRRQIFQWGCLILDNEEETALQQEFAEDTDDEIRILTVLAHLLQQYPGYPVITWNGLAADLIEIKHAWDRLRLMPNIIGDLQDRHVDLMQATIRMFRLPITSFRLKEVADYFGYHRAIPDIASFDIPLMYISYLNRKRKSLKRKILAHNADDLWSLLLVWQSLHLLQNRAE